MKKLLVGSECLLILKPLLLGQDLLACLSIQLLATTIGAFAATSILSKLKLRERYRVCSQPSSVGAVK